MLKPAQAYKDRLYEEYINTWYKPENIFYTGWTGDSMPELPDNNYDSHHFVSVDKNDNLIGYISYSVDWIAMSTDRFGIISFDKGNILFAKDVYKAICDLFEVYHMNRISWCAYADNPAIHDKGTHNVDISENVQGAETAHRVDDEAAGRKRTGIM